MCLDAYRARMPHITHHPSKITAKYVRLVAGIVFASLKGGLRTSKFSNSTTVGAPTTAPTESVPTATEASTTRTTTKTTSRTTTEAATAAATATITATVILPRGA